MKSEETTKNSLSDRPTCAIITVNVTPSVRLIIVNNICLVLVCLS